MAEWSGRASSRASAQGDLRPVPRVLMLVSATADQQLRDEVDRGERPRPEYLRLERDFGVELLDWSQIAGANRRSASHSLRHVASAMHRLDRYDVVFSDGEHVGLPLAFAMRGVRHRPAHLMIGHHLTTRAKRVLFRLGASGAVDRVIVHSHQQLLGATSRIGVAGSSLAELNYCIDTDFWRPVQVAEEALLAAPGLEHRDHRTLANAVGDLPVRVFVTGSSAHSATARAALPESWPSNFRRDRPSYRSLREIYARSRIVVVPLLPADFPAGVTTVLEAMACGKPLVVSATEGRPDVLRDGENCLLVRPGSVHDLRAAVNHLLEHPTERVRLGRNGIRSARQHDLSGYVARLADHLKELAPTAGPQTL